MKIRRPKGLIGENGGEPIRVADILPYLPKTDCFFDSRHWIAEDISNGGCLPFALTTRVEANHQQYLRMYEQDREDSGR